MRTIDKIDNLLNKMNEKKKKSKLKFLFTTEDLDGVVDSDTIKRLEEAKAGGKEYDKFFQTMLKKWKVKSYKDLPKDKQKKFFDEVDAKWSADKETD